MQENYMINERNFSGYKPLKFKICNKINDLK